MATFCINHSDPEYLSLLEMTGINSAELDMLVRPYLEHTGKLPSVDMILNESDTIGHLVKTYNLKQKKDYFLSENANELDLFQLNALYRDLEITVTPSGDNRAIVEVKRRALPHRQLPVEQKLLPAFSIKTLEVLPIRHDGDLYIYELNGVYYKTNYRITRTDLLAKVLSFKSLQEAINAHVDSANYLDGTVVSAIFNSKKLDIGYDITVNSIGKLPSKFSLFKDFLYPNFIYNESIDSSFEIIDGVINVNPYYVKEPKSLEVILLLAMGHSDYNSLLIINNLSYKVDYETIADGQNNFIVRKVINSLVLTDNITSPQQETVEDSRNSIEFVLDRLEEIYGIKFNRITTEELKQDNFKDLISDVYGVHAFILNGEIYVNVDNMTLDSPIHELGHLLLGSLRQTKPALYILLVNSVESLPNYLQLLGKYPNRARMDANEEIFVDLFAKHYVSGLDLNIDLNLLEESEYEIKRNIDSAIFPNTSVTTLGLEQLVDKSFNDIMALFGTMINRDTLAKAFTNPDGFNTRYLANLKLRLLENESLKEYCI